MRALLLLNFLLLSATVFAADEPAPVPHSIYDAALAQRLGADERGMKRFVMVILKTGPKTDIPKEALDELFKGHMANIGRLADAGQLMVAGPLVKNDQNYRGIFIFNVGTIEEARALVATDPAVAAGVFDFEAYQWYVSAALQQIPAIHKRINKNSH